MSKFTPGPWEMRHDGSRKWCEYIITGKNNGTFTPTTATIPRYTGQDEANARLIAAAPELYETLKELINRLYHNAMAFHELPKLMQNELINKGRRALAKVEKGE